MKELTSEQKEAIAGMTNLDGFEKEWKRLHTPITSACKVGRNDICPYCNSGKKFKNCECYELHKNDYVQF